MKRIRDYTERFFKAKPKNRLYGMSTDDMILFLGAIQEHDGNNLFKDILVLFDYGYVKGYRACQAEQKNF